MYLISIIFSVLFILLISISENIFSDLRYKASIIDDEDSDKIDPMAFLFFVFVPIVNILICLYTIIILSISKKLFSKIVKKIEIWRNK
jgi:hypothetical protein